MTVVVRKHCAQRIKSPFAPIIAMRIPQDQILMGVGIASICLTGIVRSRWILANTRKGQNLVTRYGETTAQRVVWLVCLLGIAFGSLLASGIVRPIAW